MLDPAHVLSVRLKAAITSALGDDFGDTDPMLRPSAHSDFQANLAMALAKRLGEKPRELALRIVQELRVADLCEKVEIAGPGFINLTLKPSFIAEAAQALLGEPSWPKPEHPDTIVIDYSAPNVAKEMHVGHLRSTIIGDALARILTRLGHSVTRQNHIGDWGTPFGMLIEHLLDLGESEATSQLSVGELNTFYKAARAKFDADAGFQERARKRVVALQAGDAETRALWQLLVDKSTAYFSRVYEELGILLTPLDVRGESFYNPELPGTVAELEALGLARLDEGALCVFPEGFLGRQGEPLPLIVRKQDGGYGYATTDLAALRYRTRTLGATRLLYVVGSAQQQHFAMVFATARAAGWLPEGTRTEHVSFGAILGTDKKIFRTRAGDTVRLSDLLAEAVERAEAVVKEKSPELEPEAARAVARMVGLGAVKYADLSNDRVKDYVFDYDRMLAFEGNTAPYLQYAHARIAAIFRKAGVASAEGPILLEAPEERALALHLLGFRGLVSSVGESLELQKLCTYLYDLATQFMTFYERCPVLKAEAEATRESRLALARLSANTLREGLGLLGIEAPERM
jgi:arginyl-tRNA synthetase